VDRRFAEVDKQFDKVDERFAEVDKRFDKVDERFAEVDKRFDKVDERFAEVDKRFDKVDEQFAEVDKRFEKVEWKIESGIKELRGEMNLRFQGLDARFDSLQRSVFAAAIVIIAAFIGANSF
jgi:DNA anti-recombination protein RmuC